MRKTLLLTAASLLSAAITCSAAPTVQAWYHFGDPANPQDSSGNARHFRSAYSHVPPNNPAFGGSFSGIITPTGIGGPLGTSGYTSTTCTRAGYFSTRICTTWDTGYNPPLTDFFMEISVLPYGKGYMGGSAWLFSSGQNAGSYILRVKDNGDGTSSIVATIQGYGDIGNPVPLDTNRWIHLAMVNDNGVTTFYTNGVACGPSDTGHATTASSGSMFIGNPDAWQGPDGLLDEARICTFAPGTFSTADLLIKPVGPNIVGQPQNATVWAGGAVPFSVTAVTDPSLAYQWRRNGTDVGGATSSTIFIPQVAAGDSGNTYLCVVSGGGLSVTSSPATLTVLAANPSNVNAYRSAINAEPSLVGYFPVDGSTGTTVANTKDSAQNGTLELKATYDGRTNRAFGERALAFNADGDVQVPNQNSAFEFVSGNGTIEALVYLNNATTDDATIAALTMDGVDTLGYAIRVSKDGGSLIYSNDFGQLTWTASYNLVGRLSHVAFVFDNTTNVTAYLDGISLGTKQQPAFGYGLGAPLWIGAIGKDRTTYRWVGTIDELAIYSAALSQNTVQTHYSKYFYGTNTAAPSIVSQPASKTLLAGGSPLLIVKAAGTLPLSYQWSSNGVPIAGATTAELSLPQTTVASSATYRLAIANAFGSTNTDPIVLTFQAPPAGYATAVMNSHPKALWRLNDTGSVAVDSAGMNDAVFSGSMTKGAAGFLASDTSVNFTGGDAQAPWSKTLNNPAGPFTAEFWIKPNNTSLTVPLSSQNRATGRSGYALYQYNGGDNLVADLGLVGNTGVYRWTATPGPKVGEWMHVVFTSDGVTVNLYTDGVLKATDTGFVFGTDIMANSAAPLVIGNRNGGGLAFNGAIDEVAIYDYALTQPQVTDHWSYIWSAAAMVTQPASITTNEWATVNLTAVASGIPNTYKWQKGGVDLAAVNNPDGTPHYPNGVNSPTLTISQAHPADNGQYRLVVINQVGGVTSANATLTITADTTKPTAAYAAALPTPNPLGGPTPYLVRITFSEWIDMAGSLTPGNYVFSGSVTVSQVTLGSDNKTVYISTSGLAAGQKYSVAISGIADQAQTPNLITPTTAWVWAPVYQNGMVWDFYPNIQNGVANLTGSPYYPNAPYTNRNTLTFDSGEITGGDLNNRVGFVGIGGNYGCSLSGWITPTVTTNYYFYLASDDASELYLSPDANPANAIPIATEASCCHGFQESGNPTTSALQPLQAGTSYFIRALQTEGGGGDYVKVAWKMEGDPTYSTNLVPIASTYLKAYAELPTPKFNAPTFSGGMVTISWIGGGTLLESTDFQNWTPVPGNPPSPYQVSAASAALKFYRVVRQ